MSCCLSAIVMVLVVCSESWANTSASNDLAFALCDDRAAGQAVALQLSGIILHVCWTASVVLSILWRLKGHFAPCCAFQHTWCMSWCMSLHVRLLYMRQHISQSMLGIVLVLLQSRIDAASWVTFSLHCLAVCCFWEQLCSSDLSQVMSWHLSVSKCSLGNDCSHGMLSYHAVVNIQSTSNKGIVLL